MTDALLEKLKDAQTTAALADAAVIRSEFDGMICNLWRRGFNTFDIARYAKIDEATVANRLAKLRDEGAL